MGTENRVVVSFQALTTYHEKGRLFASRFPEMGITAYGDTLDEALREMKLSFNAYIHELRKRGILEATLDRLGITWEWEPEYAETGSAYEDTDSLLAPRENTPPLVSRGQVLASAAASWTLVEPEVAANTDLAAAA